MEQLNVAGPATWPARSLACGGDWGQVSPGPACTGGLVTLEAGPLCAWNHQDKENNAKF